MIFQNLVHRKRISCKKVIFNPDVVHAGDIDATGQYQEIVGASIVHVSQGTHRYLVTASVSGGKKLAVEISF